MFTESAELYVAIYASFKDYAREAGEIAALLQSERPGSQTVLDVACGTGEHAQRLTVSPRCGSTHLQARTIRVYLVLTLD